MVPERRRRAAQPDAPMDLGAVEERGRQALASLLRDLPADVALLGFLPPAGYSPFAPPGAAARHRAMGLEIVALDDPPAAPLPDLPGMLEIHPPGPVYAEYARRLADRLTAAP